MQCSGRGRVSRGSDRRGDGCQVVVDAVGCGGYQVEMSMMEGREWWLRVVMEVESVKSSKEWLRNFIALFRSQFV